jgi:hypothetical protein
MSVKWPGKDRALAMCVALRLLGVDDLCRTLVEQYPTYSRSKMKAKYAELYWHHHYFTTNKKGK